MSSTPNATTTTKTPPFTLSAPPGTDIWRKPPSHNAFNAPTHPQSPPNYPLASFQRARLTFSLPPASQLRQYDQAGILLHLTKPGLAANETKWLKSGIEFYDGKPYLATVGCDVWADWSLSSVLGTEASTTATIEARRERDALGKSLWVYAVEGEERRPLREVNWFFADEGWVLSVAAYVARPAEAGDDELLEVVFEEGVEIEVLDG